MRLSFALVIGLEFLLPIHMMALSLDREVISYPTSYVYPVDDERVTPLPYVALRGKLIRHTFPGAPNYENIENGDYPETRWVLEISKTEVQRLIDSNYITEDLYHPDEEGWVQVIAIENEESPRPLLNKQVVAQGYLGTLIYADCYYCGKFPNKVNGIDRVNNSVGYTYDNCVPCCKRCNYLKNKTTQEEFAQWVIDIYPWAKKYIEENN